MLIIRSFFSRYEESRGPDKERADSAAAADKAASENAATSRRQGKRRKVNTGKPTVKDAVVVN